MALTNDDLERVRLEIETKINSVNVSHVSMAQAISSYGERFTSVDTQFDAVNLRLDSLAADMDRRFEGQAADIDRRFEGLAADIDRRFTDVRGDITRLDGRIDRLDSKLDARFNVQTVLMTVLGILILFGDPIRAALGI